MQQQQATHSTQHGKHWPLITDQQLEGNNNQQCQRPTTNKIANQRTTKQKSNDQRPTTTRQRPTTNQTHKKPSKRLTAKGQRPTTSRHKQQTNDQTSIDQTTNNQQRTTNATTKQSTNDERPNDQTNATTKQRRNNERTNEQRTKKLQPSNVWERAKGDFVFKSYRLLSFARSQN